MKYYVRAYCENNMPILGAIDGQGVIHCTNYKRSLHYKRLVNLPKEKLSLNGYAKKYLITDEKDNTLEIIVK